MVELRILGSVEVECGGRPVVVGSAQQRRLLAVLIVHAGHVVSADGLIEVLWGDAPPRSAVKTLHTYVSRLRARLAAGCGDGLVRTRAPGYVLDVDRGSVDAVRFERLVGKARAATDPAATVAVLDEALALWRGPALAEFAGEDFAQAAVARLEELHQVGLELRADARLALGQHAEVAAELEVVCDRQPLREAPHGQHMVALYRSGRHADALAVYQALRVRLADELGLAPSPALQDLERRVLQHDPGLAWEPQMVTVSPPPAAVRLPTEVTSFVGRDEQRDAVVEALGESRLVTLTGVGGVGKTRLALQVARTVAGRYPDGVWWCELAPIVDPGSVPDVVASSIGARQGAAQTALDAVVQQIGGRQLLVVADNCEHVLTEVATLLDAVVRHCPRVTVLATSRARLGLSGEQVISVPPLAVEPSGGPAVTLFLDRARAVRPELDLGPANRDAIVDVCRQLDGLPLAIELAAARVHSLNPDDLVARLVDRFSLLRRRGQEAVDRHRSLTAVVEWSYGLLSENERLLFERVSVFAGGFTLDAAERVGAGGTVGRDEVVDLLGHLVDHSMVVPGPSGGQVRYSLLETLRQYGRERLDERGELSERRALHAAHYVAVAEMVAPALRDGREAAAVASLEIELANLRAAQLHCVEAGRTDLALRLAVALFRYAMFRLQDEVLRWAAAAVDMPTADDHPRFAAASAAAGWGCGLRGERAAAERYAERALTMLDADDPERAGPVEVLAHLALWEGRLDECLRLCADAEAVIADPYELLPRVVRALALAYDGRAEEASEVAGRLRDDAERLGNPTMLAAASYALGEALMIQDPTRAAALFDRAATLARSVRNRLLSGVAAVSAASLLAREGEPTAAFRSFETVMDDLQGASDWTHLWTGLRSLVELLTRIGADHDAAFLHAAVTHRPTAPPVYGEDSDRLRDHCGDRSPTVSDQQPSTTPRPELPSSRTKTSSRGLEPSSTAAPHLDPFLPAARRHLSPGSRCGRGPSERLGRRYEADHRDRSIG